jgi:hypothetical protein
VPPHDGRNSYDERLVHPPADRFTADHYYPEYQSELLLSIAEMVTDNEAKGNRNEMWLNRAISDTSHNISFATQGPACASFDQYGILMAMTKLLEEAIARVETLPEAAQEKIGGELLDYVDKVERLRAELQKGIDSLDRGEGRPLEIDDIIHRARARHAAK